MIYFADISQYQPTFNADAYIAAGYEVLIHRMIGKDGMDATMPKRRDYIRKYPFKAVGYYCRLNPSSDPRQVAMQFCDAIGNLRDNEFPILDLEDGDGNQIDRANQWFAVVDAWAEFLASLYSGEYFLDTNLGGHGEWGKRPLWIANYSKEPSGYDWWQQNDTSTFPGISPPTDKNMYRGSAADFAKLVCGASTQPSKTTQDPRGGDPLVVVNKDGRLEAFQEQSHGEVFHRWQEKPNKGWVAGWHSLGRP
jgi:GH25 family lysozyme M1 (1,4-beta-N-acetylmuramidase)